MLTHFVPSLVSEMRAYGVIPVAVWDQRGVREWKSAEVRFTLIFPLV